jgi:peptidoglycan-associated lipoprotein
MKALPLLAVTAALTAACSSTPSTPVAPRQPAQQLGDSGANRTAQMPSQAAAPMVSELDDPSSPLAKRSIYFPYDNFIVDSKYEGMLHAHSGYLGHHPEARMAIEGSADERGSREYNLALGQKRAEAAKRLLILNGAAEQQVEAISYGEERPKATCHEESCWQENRRDDLTYTAPGK